MSRHFLQISLLIALATIIFTVELNIQTPVLWFRLGLANTITLLALKWWRLREGLMVVLGRILLGSLISGKFMHPVILLAIGGGLSAAVAMAFGFSLRTEKLSLIGISIIGAFFHNMAQLLLVALVFIHQEEVFFLFPVFCILSVITGTITGSLACIIDQKISPHLHLLPK